MPTLKQLRYFAALAETLHFGRAAARCQVTQPALSMQIRELEAELGVVLVERTPAGVFLTAAGEDVADRARAASCSPCRTWSTSPAIATACWPGRSGSA